MRVLLVTFTDLLPLIFMKILNPALEYCAIVVDEDEKAKKILANVPPLRDKIFPIYELKECIENYHYDFAVCVSLDWNALAEECKTYGLPKNKIVNIWGIGIHPQSNFLIERSLRYFKEHSAEFEMFSTGMSYALAINPIFFKLRLFNFAQGTQDLYYDYQIAKFVFAQAGGGVGTCPLKYALIGLAPYSFHFDESKTYGENFRLLQYAIAFNDLHNFWMPVEQYKNIFQQEYLNLKLPFESEINSVNKSGDQVNYMNFQTRISARKRIDVWKNRNFPDTRKENIKILDDYLTLCEKNNVRPIMFLTPVTAGYMKYFSKPKLDEFYYLVREAQKKHPSSIFFDGWKLPPFPSTDFVDTDHMNASGAAKFSTILNNFVEQLER